MGKLIEWIHLVNDPSLGKKMSQDLLLSSMENNVFIGPIYSTGLDWFWLGHPILNVIHHFSKTKNKNGVLKITDQS